VAVQTGVTLQGAIVVLIGFEWSRGRRKEARALVGFDAQGMQMSGWTGVDVLFERRREWPMGTDGGKSGAFCLDRRSAEFGSSADDAIAYTARFDGMGCVRIRMRMSAGDPVRIEHRRFFAI